MRILIVEDERHAAERLIDLLKTTLGEEAESIKWLPTLTAGSCHIWEQQVDLLFLDLNLNDEDGFELLQQSVSGAFHTIVVSGSVDRAIEAFDYGVIDFIAKPVSKDRLQEALNKFNNVLKVSGALKIISIVEDSVIKTIDIDSVEYFQKEEKRIKIKTSNGLTYSTRKTLKKLSQLLPSSFFHVHKSYVANLNFVSQLSKPAPGQYQLHLKSGAQIPLSRSAYSKIKDKINVI